jgi:hypothetical protein
MLVELSVMEQRSHAVMEVVSGGVGLLRSLRQGVAQDGAHLAAAVPEGGFGGVGRSVAPPAADGVAAVEEGLEERPVEQPQAIGA